MKLLAVRTLVPLGAMLLAACAPNSKNAREAALSPEETVAQRAQARWDHLIARDFAAAYDYLSPAFRQTRTRDAYAAEMSVRPLSWKSAKVDAVSCPQGELHCDATILIEYQITVPVPSVGSVQGQTRVQERWIESGDGWYHVPREIAGY